MNCLIFEQEEKILTLFVAAKSVVKKVIICLPLSYVVIFFFLFRVVIVNLVLILFACNILPTARPILEGNKSMIVTELLNK